jgi:defect-in-organelle-trafficking protein DotD
MRSLGQIVTVLLLLSGCCLKHTAATRHTSTAMATAPEMALSPEIKLTEAATSVTHSLHQLAEIEEASKPAQPHLPPPDPASYGMEGLASIDWNGPIEPLVTQVATASHYRLRVLGNEPAIPIIVSLSKKNVPLADVLRDAGLQAGSRAEVIVFPSSKTIELRYKAE